MGFKVVFTPQSLRDLEEAVTFIAKDNPERAAAFGHALIDRALSTAVFPERGLIVREIGDPSIRQIVHGSYRIIYEVLAEEKAIFVLRFWHGARGAPEVAAPN